MNERLKALFYLMLGVVLALGYGTIHKRFVRPFFAAYSSSTQKPEIIPDTKGAILGASSDQPNYNFERMLRLIDEALAIKKNFYKQFSMKRHNFDDKDAVDIKLLKKLLEDLYRERVRLKRYTWELKVRFKGDVPPKKMRTVIYYQRVVDNCCSDLEAILRKL